MNRERAGSRSHGFIVLFHHHLSPAACFLVTATRPSAPIDVSRLPFSAPPFPFITGPTPGPRFAIPRLDLCLNALVLPNPNLFSCTRHPKTQLCSFPSHRRGSHSCPIFCDPSLDFGDHTREKKKLDSQLALWHPSQL